MEFNHSDTHFAVAEDFLEVRSRIDVLPAPAADVLLRLERRLQLALSQIARERSQPAAPGEPNEVFIATAATLINGEADVLAKAWALAGEQPELAPTIIEALALYFPGDLAEEPFPTLYGTHPEQRAALFDLYRRLGRKLDPAQVTSAELQTSDPALQAAALRYAAERPDDFAAEQFRPYYQNASREVPPEMLQAALWGGLLRGDPEAVPALARAAERAEEKAPLFRLMALSGDAELLPLLREAAMNASGSGLPRLGLFGRKEVVPDLLDALERPETAEAAALGWQWLFGEELTRKPRMAVVIDGAKEAVMEAGEIPDVEAARSAWRKREPGWSEGRRYWGRPLDAGGAARVAAAFGGRAGRDALDLLALITRGKSCLDPGGWMELRRERLGPLAGPSENNTSGAKPEVANA